MDPLEPRLLGHRQGEDDSPLVSREAWALCRPPGGFRRIQSCLCVSVSLPHLPCPPTNDIFSAGRGCLPQLFQYPHRRVNDVNASEKKKPPLEQELPQRKPRPLVPVPVPAAAGRTCKTTAKEIMRPAPACTSGLGLF